MSVLAVRSFGRTAGRPPAASPSAITAPPKFFVTVGFVNGRADQIQIRRTSDGKLTATAPPLPGGLVAGGLSAANDHTFVLAGYRYNCPSGILTRFYQLTITANGHISGFRSVGAQVYGQVDSISVTPDGTQAAFIRDGACSRPDLDTTGVIRVMNLTK
ncbi:MAG: hypothetical protein JO345_18050 [Streptosporangiaceae bacterium]|nr:hypothetical protein [Streptosporangiaceae bacterium]